MIEKNDIKALIRTIALAVTNDPSEAEKVVEWAYKGQEKAKRARPVKKEDEIDMEAVERIYAIYPSSVFRPEGNKATLKSTKDKEKIARLLKVWGEQRLTNTINKYIAEVNPPYTKMLSTFLNNIPDYGVEQNKPAIKTEDGNFFDNPELAAIYKARHK